MICLKRKNILKLLTMKQRIRQRKFKLAKQKIQLLLNKQQINRKYIQAVTSKSNIKLQKSNKLMRQIQIKSILCQIQSGNQYLPIIYQQSFMHSKNSNRNILVIYLLILSNINDIYHIHYPTFYIYLFNHLQIYQNQFVWICSWFTYEFSKMIIIIIIIMSRFNFKTLQQMNTTHSLIQNPIENINWKKYILPEVMQKYNQINNMRQSRSIAMKQMSQQGKEQDDDLCQKTDKQKIQILIHQNENLKEELRYLRETLLKVLSSPQKI